MRFVENVAGIDEALSQPGVQKIVTEKADEICARANAMAEQNTVYRHHGGLYKKPYMVNSRTGRYVALANVATATRVGMWDAATNNTLRKAKVGG